MKLMSFRDTIQLRKSVTVSSSTLCWDCNLTQAVLQVLTPIPLKIPAGGWTSANKPYQMKLMDSLQVQQQTYSIAFNAVPFSNDIDIDLEYQWMSNAMQNLWAALLRGDKGYGDLVSQQLMQDANNLSNTLGIAANASADEKA